MVSQSSLHPERLFSSDPVKRAIAKSLYLEIKDLPIVSPHGHTDAKWFAENKPFNNPVELLIQPDHYLLRMLYSQGISLENLGIEPAVGNDKASNGEKLDTKNSTKVETNPKKIWEIFAKHYYLFLGTPTKLWLDHVFAEVFSLEGELTPDTADEFYEHINKCLQSEGFLPRNLFERFNIEVIATTESPLDDLNHHQRILDSGWQGRVITAFRPDNVVDPEFEGFEDNLAYLSTLTGESLTTFSSYLKALKIRRDFFKRMGATSTDHGHPTPKTLDLSLSEKEALYLNIRSENFTAEMAENFRAQMLTEMASMSLDDGLVMQIHPGVHRNHNPNLFETFGRDKGADIPVKAEFVDNLKPLLTKYGNHKELTIILFTLDETTYSRELAPLAGHYPALKLGPAWWFNDSPEGMKRYRQQVTESSGFYNTVGFNDDTRAFMSIPARHDVARRMDCVFLAELVAEHRITEAQAHKLAYDLSYRLAKEAYKL